jgi:hypothetical protein
MRSTNLLLFFLPLCAVAWDSEYVVKYSCYLTEETSGSFEDVPHVGLEVKTDQGQRLFIETMGGWTKVKWPGSTKKECSKWRRAPIQASIQDLIDFTLFTRQPRAFAVIVTFGR